MGLAQQSKLILIYQTLSPCYLAYQADFTAISGKDEDS